ncbi:hypothetical protein [Nocardioides panzhihuensis]|uniref:DUF3558 domain-containing protein n=1 Tax=Nocardioides panzhihuensis TaxID=860243 RepID=A0A7Z0DN47_9ACTN|nr:hypothetical protein [Nocardioides panzhihuensis]NYI78700.1 hypothetical protein [Nocardioides panzhihuensis]
MHFRAAPMVVLLAATSGCGAETVPVTTEAPTPFSASSASVPQGFAAAECLAVVGGKAATLKLVVPDGFAAESTGPSEQTPGGQCTWRTSEDRFLSVEVGETESLLDLNGELKEYEGIGGDDEVKDVTYDAPTDAFGELEGERLSWWSYSDGMPADCVQVQANGIRLFWQNPDDIDQRLDDLDIVLDSVELIRS